MILNELDISNKSGRGRSREGGRESESGEAGRGRLVATDGFSSSGGVSASAPRNSGTPLDVDRENSSSLQTGRRVRLKFNSSRVREEDDTCRQRGGPEGGGAAAAGRRRRGLNTTPDSTHSRAKDRAHVGGEEKEKGRRGEGERGEGRGGGRREKGREWKTEEEEEKRRRRGVEEEEEARERRRRRGGGEEEEKERGKGGGEKEGESEEEERESRRRERSLILVLSLIYVGLFVNLVPVEMVLLAAGDCVGHANLAYASRINKGVVVFVKEERLVAELVASGVTVGGVYLQVSPLAAWQVLRFQQKDVGTVGMWILEEPLLGSSLFTSRALSSASLRRLLLRLVEEVRTSLPGALRAFSEDRAVLDQWEDGAGYPFPSLTIFPAGGQWQDEGDVLLSFQTPVLGYLETLGKKGGGGGTEDMVLMVTGMQSGVLVLQTD
ncbi:ephrin type-B receptor 4b-like [Xyrichtys novacula]|uniref:Ephrin type-B receptor 4b-like n=1 Tax=Xyrichtys novacula TaxID=13765 RepID=A0AAV1HJD8_XYRNO|nr:ephrin type-B receptor 4b-like [Xyrichtys novacula]